MPDYPPTDNSGQIHLVGQTMAMLLIGEKIDGQWQATPGQHAHQALLPQRTHQTIEGHRGDMIEDRAPLQTQATVCGQQRVASRFRSHLAVAQDEVREHSEYRFIRRALYPPDGDPAPIEADIVRVAVVTLVIAADHLED